MCDNAEADRNCPDDETGETPTPKKRATSESLDGAFEVLADGNRRAVVAHFLEADVQTATLPELAERCRRDLDGSRGSPSADRVALRLHHQHLPKMEDAGVIEYDTRSETVRYRGDALVESLLGYVRERDDV